MAMSKQISPTQALVTFCLWARRKGYDVGEMTGFSTVHQVHGAGSFHYDQDGGFGHAADINWPGGGVAERAQLIAARKVAEGLGLAVFYAEQGIDSITKTHQDHLHTDVGSYSDLGHGYYTPKGGGDVVTTALQAAVRAGQDMIWGPDTDRRLELVRAASSYCGTRFPQGVAETQRVVGTGDDGDWGSNSRAAHDHTVAQIQIALGFTGPGVDGIWGKNTEAVYQAARDVRHRQ